MNLAYLIDRRLDLAGDRPAILHASGARTGWPAFARRVAALQGWLAARRLAPGDRVALLAANAPEFAEAVLAAARGGFALVPLNWRLAPAELADQLGDSEPRVLILDEAYAALAEKAGWRGPVLRIGAEYERALAAAEPAASMVPVAAEHTLGIFYTGGTTGRAKGVMLSHGNLLANALHVRAVVPFREDDTHLHAAPMFHLADLGYFIVQLVDGGAHCFLPQFRPAAFFETMARHKVTTTLLAPTMLALAMADPSYGRHDLSAWRQIEYGGSPIAEPVLKRALAELPCRFFQGYGQTEATHTICTMPHEEHVAAAADPRLLASCGRAIAGVHLRLVDEADRAVPAGEIGELVARSPTVMTGYWRRPKETAEALRGGWLRTGDLGTRDAEGRVYLVDRKKDMIVSGAENVFSAEVEQALAQHASVAECAVIGVPDPRTGERVHAVVALKPGAAADAEALQAHCRAAIAGYKVPRSFEFVPALPKTAFGKVQKAELRKAHWQGQSRAVG